MVAERPPLTDKPYGSCGARYPRRDPAGQVVETPEGPFRRVAHSITQAEASFGDTTAPGRWEEAFLDALIHLDFLPNFPTLMNTGTRLGQLSACFVLPVEDSMEELVESLKFGPCTSPTAPTTARSPATPRDSVHPQRDIGGPRQRLHQPVSKSQTFIPATRARQED